MIKFIKRWLIKTFGPVNQIQKYIEKYWNSPDSFKNIPGLETRVWNLHQSGILGIVHSRQVRGDLIEVFYDSRLIISYVDQTHAYGGLLGINDVLISASPEELDFLYENICPNYVHHRESLI